MHRRLLKAGSELHLVETSDEPFTTHYSEYPLTKTWVIDEVPGTVAEFDAANPKPERILVSEKPEVYKWKHTDGKYYKIKTPLNNPQRVEGEKVINRYAEAPDNLTEEM